MDESAKVLLLEMQVEELMAKLSEEEDLHNKASARATAAERRNKSLREKVSFAEGELSTLEMCWNCPDLGNRDICKKCTNSAVFMQINGTWQWRSYPNERGQGNGRNG